MGRLLAINPTLSPPQDVREMERRKRVEALMSSRLFREELERVLDQQASEGADAPLLQRIREMVGGRLHSGSMRVRFGLPVWWVGERFGLRPQANAGFGLCRLETRPSGFMEWAFVLEL